MKTVFRSRLLASTLLIGSAALAGPAFAQSTQQPADDPAAATASSDGTSDDAPGDVVVTGSRIARPELEAASPVTTVSQEQIAITGTQTLENLLNELPQVIPGNTRVSNNSGGENFATLDLRGLGPNRTLILLNGERLPPSTTTGVTDISQIPTGLIQRVDVVTGGASAVYGSDAIAGVINFILRDDYQGLEVTGQTNIAEEGIGFNFAMNGILGGNFADGKGNITVYASYFDRDAVSQSRLPYSRTSGALLFDNTLGTTVLVDQVSEFPTNFGGTVSGGGSATSPFTSITTNTAANPFRNLATLLPAQFGAANTDCNPATAGAAVNAGTLSFNDAGALTPFFSGGFCNIPLRSIGSSRYNFAPNNFLITPFDRLTFSTLAKYELDEDTMFRFYGAFTNANQAVNLAPTPATGIVTPADAFGISADLRTALNSRPDPAASFVVNRRFTETGPRDGRFKTESINLRGIIEHDFGGNWKGNIVGSFGRVDNTIRGIGNINAEAVAQGIRGCRNAAGVVNGPGVLPGCVPVNLFAPLTAAMTNFVRIDTQTQETFEQVRGAANLTGSLFDLPAGPVGVAIGAEYRKDTAETVVDDAFRRGNVYGFNAVQGIAGSINVKEVYGEIRAPILATGDGRELLAVGTGGRYSDYSSIGGLFNYKFEAEFAPLRQVRFRGTYNKAARAPNVFELFRNGDQGFPAFVDPCNATNATRNVAQCIATGVPAAAIPGFAQVNAQVQAFAFGNPFLTEEKAETWTAGAVITPGRIFGGNLNLTVDYYNIKLTDSVSGLGAGTFLSRCYSGLDASACARITRDPGTGQVTAINTTVANAADPIKFSGVDVGFDWSIPFNVFGEARLTISDTFSYTEKYFAGGGVNYADTVFSGIGGVIPEFSNAATVGYRTDRFTGQVRYIWKKGPRQNFAGAELDGLLDGPSRIPDLNLVNLSLRYQVSDNFELTGIVNNLLDKFPPQTVTGFFEQANTNINFYDPYALGRNYTMQARIRF